MNSVYADTNAGATSFGTASYGYGQSPALSTSIAVGAKVQAAEWASLFNVIKNCGNHQGTTVVPPLPGVTPGYDTGSTTVPVAGNTIVAYNTPSGALTTLLNTLITNRFNLYTAQTAFTSSPFAQPGATPWTNTLTFNYRANFGSWDHARYFFNAGGFLTLSGNYPSPSTPEEIEWQAMFTQMSPLKFTYNATTPNTGGGGTAIGFYNLTTSPQVIYFKNYGSGVYTASYIQVSAWLVNAAGTDGQVNFSIELVNLDSSPPPTAKNGTTTFTVSEFHSAGAIAYPGTVVLSSLGFIST
jgi:hypothetical protein